MTALSRDQTVALAYIRREGEASESALVWEGLHAPWRTLDALSRRGLVVRGEWLCPEDGYVWRLSTKETLDIPQLVNDIVGTAEALANLAPKETAG